MRHHHGLPDSLVLRQGCFDLSKFDPMPTNLHLEINPPKKVHITVAPVANKVAGPIKTRRSRSRKRVFDESLCGQFQPVQVAAGDTLSANEQFAGIVRDKMQSAARLKVPLIVDVGIGANWKDAKP